MAGLSLALLGAFQAQYDGQAVQGFRSDKVQALLIYLATERNSTHPRERLMTMLWPGMPEGSARHNLRQVLYHLRRAFPKLPSKPQETSAEEDNTVPLLTSDRRTIQLNPLGDVEIDVDRFEQLLDSAKLHDHPGTVACPDCLAALEEAVALYRGDFLEDFYLEDSNQFEDWVEANRENYRRNALDALERLVTISIHQEDYEKARGYTIRQLEIDRLRESAHRQLMEVLVRMGQRTAALRQYEECLRLLDEELGVAPSQETTALFEAIKAGDLTLQEGTIEVTPAPPPPAEPPFKGLHHFDVADAGLFFGRELLTARLVGKLHQESFLAVVGASGSGKSSLVRAGLIPALMEADPLADGNLPPTGSLSWPVHIITPTARPLESLAASLTREVESVTATGTLIDDLISDPRSLHLYVRKLLSQGGGERLFLLVDQFEELFTMCRAEGERAAFIENLITAVDVDTAGPTLVVITLRADFYAHCAQYPKLRSLLEAHQVYIGQMETGELRRAIEGPAHQEGYEFEPGLVDLMLRDIGAGENSQPEPGALPLLSHALLETWKRRADRTLTLSGYTEAGGVTGAIARTADRVLQGLDDDQRVIARRVFLRLTELGEGTQDTRRRAALSELFTGAEDLPEIERVLHTLSDARLITTRKESIEIAHEALIREWPTLREWLEENREGLRAHRHLSDAALEWERLGGDPGELYRGARLAIALDWGQEYGSEMSSLEQEFLAASQEFKEAAEREKEAAREQELAQARRLANTQRQRALFLLGGLVVAVVLSLIAFTLRGQADQERHAALTAQAKAEELTRFAQAGELSALGLTQLEDQLDLALLLSIEAYNTASTRETRENLFTAWQRSPDLGRFLRGHSGGVLSVAWSKDGRLASGSSDNSVIIWDLESGQPVQILHGHTDIVNSVAWSGDGRLASASKDRSIIIWDLESGEPSQTLVGHTNGVTSVAWSADGRLASGSRDQTVILWDLATGQPEQTMVGHTNAVNSVAWSLDGWLASASQDKSIIIWDVDSRRPAQTLVGHTGSVQNVAWSSNGRLASASRDNTVIIWDVSASSVADLENVQPAQTLQGHASAVDSVAWSQDGRLASGSLDSTVIVWNLDTGQPDETFERHESAVRSVAWSDDGRLASASADNTVIAWRPLASRNAGIAGGEAVQTLSGHGSPVYNVAWSKDGRLASGSENGTLFIWDLDTGQPDKTLQEFFGGFGNRGILDLAWSGDGLLAYSVNRTVKVWNPDSELPDLELPGLGIVLALAWSADGRLVSGSGSSGSRAIYVWDVSEMLDSNLEIGEPSKFLRSNYAWSFAWFEDGRLAGSSADAIVVWDMESEQPLHTLKGHTAFHSNVAWSPDGRLASASADNAVIVWDLENEQPAITLSEHTDIVNSVAWLADGRLASGSKDGTVIIWDFSANDRLQSTANSELESGEPFQIFRLHEGGVNSIAWSPDGRLASGSEDGTVKVWELDPEVWVAQNCARAGRNLTQAEWDQYFTGEPYRKTCPQWPEGE